MSEIPEVLPHLREVRRQFIRYMAEELRRSHEPVRFVVPAYSLRNGHRLVLDGNHKMAALVMAGVPATLLVFTVAGPVNAGAVADLKFWEER